MTDTANLLGQMAAIIVLAGYFPYIISTIRGRTRPNRATWIIWAIVTIIIAVSYAESGATSTLWVAIVNAAMSVCVALLSLKYGVGGWTPFDRACLFASLASLALWQLSGSPLTALGINVLVDAIGALPTIRKAYYEPETEDRLTWVLYLIGYTVNLAAVDAWNLAIAAYPAYLFCLCAVMVWLLFLRGNKKPQGRENAYQPTKSSQPM